MMMRMVKEITMMNELRLYGRAGKSRAALEAPISRALRVRCAKDRGWASEVLQALSGMLRDSCSRETLTE